jgi:hypothetical protein
MRTTQATDVHATRAIAHLPGIDIEIVHRQSDDGLTEQISINLKATPSFEAYARLVEAFNPFAFWAEAARLAWFPWLKATHAAMLPANYDRASDADAER